MLIKLKCHMTQLHMSALYNPSCFPYLIWIHALIKVPLRLVLNN